MLKLDDIAGGRFVKARGIAGGRFVKARGIAAGRFVKARGIAAGRFVKACGYCSSYTTNVLRSIQSEQTAVQGSIFISPTSYTHALCPGK